MTAASTTQRHTVTPSVPTVVSSGVSSMAGTPPKEDWWTQDTCEGSSRLSVM